MNFGLLILMLTFSCNNKKESTNNDVETERAMAESEAAKQKVRAAEAERKTIEASLLLLQEKQRINKEEDERLIKQKEDINKETQKLMKEDEERLANLESDRSIKELNLRNKLGENALATVRENPIQILNMAYPMAANRLKYTSAKLIGTGSYDGGYKTTVRLNYKNLFRKSHYLELKFDYDSNGGYRGWKFVNHSDVIAPKELTLGTLLKLVH